MKIAYFSAGGPTMASSRLRVHKIADVLRKQGHDITINGYPWSSDVMVVQKRSDLMSVMQQARQRGIRVVYDVDDWLQLASAEDADVVTVDTVAKLELYPQAVVIPDVLDSDENSPVKAKHSENIDRVVYVGNALNWKHAENALEACRRLGIEVVCITDLSDQSYAQYPDVVGVNWTLDSVDAEMIKADVCICPYMFDGVYAPGGENWVKSKSANRLLKAWSLGLPVIGTPIPAYVEAGLWHKATTVDEWVQALIRLDRREGRIMDAERGRLLAREYRAENVAQKWLDVFNG